MTGFCTTVQQNGTQVLENRTLTNDIRSKLKGDDVVSKPSLSIGTTDTNVANVAFTFQVGGVQYSKAAVAAGTSPGTDVIPEDKYGAIALDINAAGTISIASASANATGYDSAGEAVAGIPAVASGKARMGTVSVVRAATGGFTFGTTELDDADTTTEYTDGQTSLQAIGEAIS